MTQNTAPQASPSILDVLREASTSTDKDFVANTAADYSEEGLSLAREALKPLTPTVQPTAISPAASRVLGVLANEIKKAPTAKSAIRKALKSADGCFLTSMAPDAAQAVMTAHGVRLAANASARAIVTAAVVAANKPRT